MVAANRDERLDRPSTGPALRSRNGVRFLAPRDEVAGGSWLGLNEHGLFVGLTNRMGVPNHADRQSRGELVLWALEKPSFETLQVAAATLNPKAYNAFHLLFASGAEAGLAWSDGETLRTRTLGPGIHVLTERTLPGEDSPRVQRIQKHFEEHGLTREAMTTLLQLHSEDPHAGLCIHAPGQNYGTRSSCVFWADTLEPRLLWTEGAPCQNPSQDVSQLLMELSAQPRAR